MAKLTDINSSAEDLFPIKTLDQFLPKLLQVAIIIGSLFTFIWLLWGGVEFIIAGADPERSKSAKSKITQAIVGLGLLATVWVLWRLVTYFLGISPTPKGPFNLQIPTPWQIKLSSP